MDMLLITLFSTGILTLTVERGMRVFFEKRRTHIIVAAFSYFFLWAALVLQSWWLNNAILALFVYFLALLIVSLNYESVPMKKAAAVAGSHYMLLSATAIFQSLVHFLPTTLSIDNVGFSVILSSLSIYIVALTVFPLFKHIKKATINLNKMWLPFAIFPITHTFVELFFHMNPTIVTAFLSVFNNLGIILVFFYLYNILSKTFEETLTSALHSQEKEYYFAQCQLMQESVEQVKSIRHDMKLHLAAIRDYTAHDKANEATNYLDSLLDDIGESEIYSDTGNIAFDSIINFKLKDVLSNHIDLQIKIFVPPQLNIEVSDIVTILGNLLDNAFDAVAKVEGKRIKLDVESSKGSLFIKIDNTFDGEVKYADSAGSTKQVIISRKGGDSHGYGLKNVLRIVEKYDGHMDISHEDNIFSVGILLYVDDM